MLSTHHHSGTSKSLRSTTRRTPSPGATKRPSTPKKQPMQNPQVQTYIANLQGQIHLLEMETKMLKEKVANGTTNSASLITGDEPVDGPLQDLHMLYRKLLEDIKAELEVCIF